MRPDFVGLGLGTMFALWTLNYYWSTIGLSWIGRIADAYWLLLVVYCLVVSARYRLAAWQALPWFLVFWSLLCIAMIGDGSEGYKNLLYLKTAGYVPLAFFGGMAFVHVVRLRERRWIVVLKTAAVALGTWVVAYLIYASSLGWAPGRSLLGTALRDQYQGASRLMSAAAVLAVAAKAQLPVAFTLTILSVCIVGVLSFSGMGAAGGLLLAIGWYVWSHNTQRESTRLALRAFLIAATMGLTAFAVFQLDLFTMYGGFFERLGRKLAGATAGGEQSRYWLMMRGMEEWLSGNPKDFLLGPGPVNYAHAVHYETAYRHPHNLFVGALVWFGILALPLALVILLSAKRALRLLVSRDAFAVSIGLLFVFYFGLSLIGGDFEQNRHLFLMLGAVHYCFRHERRGRQLESVALPPIGDAPQYVALQQSV